MSNSDFVLSIDRWVEKTGIALDTFVKRVVFEIYYDVVTMTPVDTGRLRANYQIGVNFRPSGEVSTFVQASPKEKGRHRATMAVRVGSAGVSEAMGKATEAMGGVTWGTLVYIVNNLPYALPIEFGSSKQAPNGMVRIAVKRMADKLKAASGVL